MKRRRVAALVVAVSFAACADPGPVVEDAHAYLPLVDGAPAVAYFTLRNPTRQRLDIAGISCSPYARVELHETRAEDGVSTMRRLDSATVEPGRELALRPGGKHLMLMEPRTPVGAGASCPLVIRFVDGGELSVRLVLRERGSRQPGGSGS